MLLFIPFFFFLPSVTAFTTIRFSSIRQCGPFNVTFSGNQPTALPLALTVVPFGSSAIPISIPLPNPEWDSKTSTGVAITFLPYPAGTTFIASLDDATGQGTGFTSDIIRILQSDDASCVSTAVKAQTYTAKPPFSQCQPFNIAFDPTQAVPPVVRLFVPNGQAPLLNRTQDSHDVGITSFTMAAFRGQPAVLLFGDGSSHLQSTDLFTVTGDVTSSKACFPPPPNPDDSGKSQQTGLSRQAVIGIVASIAGVVALLSILIAVYLFLQCRQRGRIRRTMQQRGIEGGPGSGYPEVSPPLDPPSAQSSGNIINKQTPYPLEKYTSTPVSPQFDRSTPNTYTLDCPQQMRSLNAATADLDRILNTSVFTPSGDTKAWSSTLSPSSLHSRGPQSSELPFGTREQPRATIPISPLSITSHFGDIVIPTNYVRMGITEAESGTEGGRDHAAARRSSTTVTIPWQDMMRRGERDGRGDPYP